MLSKTDLSTFLREGLSRYPDAKETVTYFEECAERIISQSLEAKATWAMFQPDRDLGGRMPIAKSIGSADRYISLYTPGSVPNQQGGQDRAWVNVGIFWNPRLRQDRVVACCHVTLLKGVSLPLADISSRDSRVTIGPLNKKSERRLLVALDDRLDAEEAFPLLLESLDVAMTIPSDATRGSDASSGPPGETSPA